MSTRIDIPKPHPSSEMHRAGLSREVRTRVKTENSQQNSIHVIACAHHGARDSDDREKLSMRFSMPASIAHVGFCANGRPFVIPMLYARWRRACCCTVPLASRLVNGTQRRYCRPASSVTLVDGLVLARSHFHHSLELSIGGGVRHRGTMVEDGGCRSRRARALRRRDLSPAAPPNRASPDRNELAATHVLRFYDRRRQRQAAHRRRQGRFGGCRTPYWAGIMPQRAVYGAGSGGRCSEHRAAAIQCSACCSGRRSTHYDRRQSVSSRH